MKHNGTRAGTNTNDQDSLIDTAADRLAQLYWSKVQDYISTRTRVADMSSEECAAWVQSGLALTPFAGCSTHTSFDWTMTWSLIGEWTSREIFLPPVGQWPRNGHPQSLPMLTWAHACFEQGSFPSMHLPGRAQLFVLPGDRMYQAQRLIPGKTRPAILHGYGGAKRDIPHDLPRIAREGWVPLATAIVEKDPGALFAGQGCGQNVASSRS